MKLPLDTRGRFVLASCVGGWELSVDEKLVHYCRTPLDALRYMAEELRTESDVEGVDRVVDALAHIDKTMGRAVEQIRLHEASETVCRVVNADLAEGSRREHVRATSLALAGCHLDEFRARPDARDIAARAKAILEPWFEAGGVE